MPNSSLVFGFLTQNPSSTRHKHLAFQTPSETSIIGIRVRYPELMKLLSIFKGTVDMK